MKDFILGMLCLSSAFCFWLMTPPTGNPVVDNYIICSLLDHMEDLTYELANYDCDTQKPEMQNQALAIKAFAEIVAEYRDSMELHVSGNYQIAFNNGKQLAESANKHIIDYANAYVGLLTQPCTGAGGQPLDNRLNGRIYFMDYGIRQLKHQHEYFKRSFK